MWRFARRVVRSRLLSGIVAGAILLGIIALTGSTESVMRMMLLLLLPVACIWFPDEMGSLKGVSFGLFRPKITETSPGDAVAVGGWLVLLSLLAAVWILTI